MSETVTCELPEVENPTMELLREERMPHIWCPGCGIGTTVNCFVEGLKTAEIDLDKTTIVSGIGCTGRVAGYINLDSFHTTHGRAIPFATGLKLGNPELNVIVYSGDGDLFSIGGNHFIHAARRNVDMLVICVNNLNYAMTGGQVAATTPTDAIATTAPYGNAERSFNTPHLAESCGAVFVARWTAVHVRQLTKTMKKALSRNGFRYIEIIAPCPTLYSRRNKLGTPLDVMNYYKNNSKVKNGADTRTVDIGFQGEIIVGNFVDKTGRPSIPEAVDEKLAEKLGKKYIRPSITDN
jgi:2-oxoglutarate/2-oxoacid ferredoxin oxidoreductase subunit beta